LEVLLERPTQYFLQLPDRHSTYIVHPEIIEAFGSIDDRGTDWTKPSNFVGNGPFLLQEWSPNKMLIVEKNPTY